MAKRFKLRLSRVLPSFQSCRSKHPSALPSHPIPSFLRLSPVNPTFVAAAVDLIPPPPPPPPTPPPKFRHSFLKRHVPSALISYGCGCSGKSSSSNTCLSDDGRTRSQPQFLWKQEGDFHVVATVREVHASRKKIYNSSASGDTEKDDATFSSQPRFPERTKLRGNKKKKTKKPAVRGRLSTSSADTESGLFSSDEDYADEREDEETETLVSSSRSLSTDSSSELVFNPQLETIREAPRRRKKKKKKKKTAAATKNGAMKRVGRSGGRRRQRKSGSGAEMEAPARLSVFWRLIPWAIEGKVRESFAVVKRSEDPYEDFKRSMVEMIMEKQMFEEEDLEQLLHCFLSLNSRDHHGVIVEAFSEICEALFTRRSSSSSLGRGL